MTRPRPRRIDRLFVALAAALALPGAPPRAAADEPPEPLEPKRVAVFAVGVENYKDPALQAENYRKNVRAVAEDAYAAFGAFRNAAGKQFAEGPSRYLLADREKLEKSPLPGGVRSQEGITRADLDKALGAFLKQLRDGDLAVVYLGGHGLAPAGTDSLYFLLSDYQQDNLLTAYLMEELLRAIQNSLAGKDVRVLVLANMCHAGNVDPERLPEVLGKARGKAGPKIVYVPACAADVKTFERQEAPFNGRSVFAHYLLRGLQGEAADKHRLITSRSLLAYLRARPELAGLPDIPDFEGPPALLRRIFAAESEMRGMLADALIACAWDLPADERRLALGLADWHLRRRREIDSAPATQFQTSLRRFQVRLLANTGGEPPLELASEVVRAAAGAKPEAPYAEAVKQINQVVAGLQPGKARVHALLASGYVGSSFSHEPERWRSDQRRQEEKFLNEHSARWARILEARSGARNVTRQPLEYVAVELNPEGTGPDPPAVRQKRKALLEALGKKVEELSRSAGREPGPLVFVYVGSGELLLQPAAGKPQAAFWGALRSWPGKIVVVWAASHGPGLEATIPEDLRNRASVFAAVGNAKAHPWAVYRVLDAFEDAFEKGLARGWEADLAPAYMKLWQEVLRRGDFFPQSDAEAPRPRWWGDTKEIPPFLGDLLGKLQAAARAAPLPTQEWAYDVACGTGGRTFDAWPPYPPRAVNASDECLTRAWQDEVKELEDELKESPGKPAPPAAPWRRLRAAALKEALGDFKQAALGYGAFDLELDRKLPGASPEASPAQEAARQARALLAKLRATVKARKGDAERGNQSPPALHLVLVPAADSYSPLTPRLPGASADVAAWEETFTKLFGDPDPEKNRLKVHKSEPGAAKGAVWAAVDKAIAGTTKDDVIVFVFSGRGYQQAGRRYLVPAGLHPRPAESRDGGLPEPSVPEADPGRGLLASSPSLQQMIDVGELTRRCAEAPGGGRSFVGIFDCQFSEPPPGTAPWPFDKHLMALFPRPKAPGPFGAAAARGRRPAQAGEGEEPARGRARHVVVVGPRGPAAHPPLLIWWAGALQEDREGDAPGKSLAASPFSRALLLALAERKGKGSYEDWACRAGKALAGDPGLGVGRLDRRGLPVGRIVVQGPVERPVLLPSVRNDTLRLLLRDYYRRRHNLDLALQLLSAHDAVLREPADQLTQAALLVQRTRYLAEVQPGEAEGPPAGPGDWQAARELLTRLKVPALLEGGPDDPAVAEAFAYYLTEALKHAPANVSALSRLRELVKGHEQVRTEFVARLLLDLTRSSVERTSNRTVQDSLDLANKFPRLPPGWEDDVRALFLPESARADLLPIDYSGRP